MITAKFCMSEFDLEVLPYESTLLNELFKISLI